MTNAEIVAVAVDRAFDEQPGWYRHKSTLIIILTGIVWVGGVSTQLLADSPEWVAVVVGAVGTLAAALVSVFTKGELTPSMTGRITEFTPGVDRDAD